MLPWEVVKLAIFWDGVLVYEETLVEAESGRDQQGMYLFRGEGGYFTKTKDEALNTPCACASKTCDNQEVPLLT